MYQNPAAGRWSCQSTDDPAVADFHRKLPDYNVTPLVPLPSLAKELGLGHVLVKDESHRFGLPAFKILGASWAVYRAVAAKVDLPPTTPLDDLSAAANAHGVELVSCTEGNWGRAVARMAKYLSIQATVFVSQNMYKTTLNLIAGEGAMVSVVQGDYDASIQAARDESAKSGALLVMDTSWPGYEEIPKWVVDGYSTMLLEADHQVHEMTGKDATCAIASVGVGSLAHAVVQHYKTQDRNATVVAVEPETAACLKTSLEAGKIVPIETGNTIMSGMNCGTVSVTAWPFLRDGVDASLTVSDIEAHRDTQYLQENGVPCGPCGAAPLSALRKLCEEGELGLGPDSVVVLFSTEASRPYPEP
ncbi:hypothetical protein W97_03031 [Coniosporium apollinis CBS 100218]|uniref:Tryptophan synthase beta chain-like PALP domain-containing protein n=1 Tax=Coniosporium apollinis (strain CBS 100218) TaxID=1168221 RepID=R7YPM3_CONA1|nr:uncharacterized protein W97_03031 [Coniosporium apollinis CBS 100218]EON63803.1 hypothetical protein W97_03031 [Coniosporium apollinis CBS 100218]